MRSESNSHASALLRRNHLRADFVHRVHQQRHLGGVLLAAQAGAQVGDVEQARRLISFKLRRSSVSWRCSRPRWSTWRSARWAAAAATVGRRRGARRWRDSSISSLRRRRGPRRRAAAAHRGGRGRRGRCCAPAKRERRQELCRRRRQCATDAALRRARSLLRRCAFRCEHATHDDSSAACASRPQAVSTRQRIIENPSPALLQRRL